MDFYAEKSRDLPRFLYRNLAETLSSGGADRQARLRDFADFMSTLQPKGDWLKLKWCFPPRLALGLSPEERLELERLLSSRRGRRNEKYLEVFPHCSDEFSYETDFLDAAFGADRFGLISRSARVFTIGSCFARNIASYLSGLKYDVTAFQQAEDLNSPFSNAKMLAVSAARPNVQRAYVEHWVKTLYPPEYAGKLAGVAEREIERLEALVQLAMESEIIVVTCGNTLDYFMAATSLPDEPGPAVAPKFFAISASEDVNLRQYLTQRMKAAGAVFRAGSYDETLQALIAQYEALRKLNKDAHFVYTLSPVPIDSAIGALNTEKIGAIERDCLSKSTLRIALADFLARQSTDVKLHYFPSFEIVRWIAPCIDGAVFGREDAASRHVSQAVLEGVCGYFVHKYCAG